MHEKEDTEPLLCKNSTYSAPRDEPPVRVESDRAPTSKAPSRRRCRPRKQGWPSDMAVHGQRRCRLRQRGGELTARRRSTADRAVAHTHCRVVDAVAVEVARKGDGAAKAERAQRRFGLHDGHK